MKTCPKCKQEKQDDDFSFNNAEHTKRDSWCRDCKNIAYRARYVKKERIPPPARTGWTEDGIGYIPLTRGRIAKVDPEDVEYLSQWNWFAYRNVHTESFYAKRSMSLRMGDNSQKTIAMQNVVLRIEDSSKIVDHINHDTLDYRKTNLRPAENRNAQNAKMRKDNSTGFKGVSPINTGGYVANIRSRGEHIYLGWRKTAEEASLLYKEAALKYHQEFACLG